MSQQLCFDKIRSEKYQLVKRYAARGTYTHHFEKNSKLRAWQVSFLQQSAIVS